ncbi:MAG TPA: ComEA family DNA-binding protein [Gammaproteobacteria bacterium]|nr:ComEA family DNA-binding protein [Gammaproteobacteria bacterium]
MKKLIFLVFFAALVTFSTLASAEPVNINTADAVTLAANIKGIGLRKAEAIVAWRKEHGAFQRVEDLALVKGIGPKTVEKNRENLMVETP